MRIVLLWTFPISFQKINKINRPVAQLTKRSKRETQIIRIRDEQRNIVIDIKEIQNIIRECFKNLYSIEL